MLELNPKSFVGSSFRGQVVSSRLLSLAFPLRLLDSRLRKERRIGRAKRRFDVQSFLQETVKDGIAMRQIG